MSETGEHDEDKHAAAARPPVDPDVFAAAWSRVEPRLFNQLVRRRGLSEESAADICQEVALRAVLYRVPFRIPTDLFRYGLVVSNRLATAALAEHERWPTETLPTAAETDTDDAEQPADWFDVEDDAATRWAVHTALAQASDADVRALRTLFDPGDQPPAGKRERDRLALQLHRAKKRLRARLDELLGALTVPGVARRLVRAVRRDAQLRTPLLAAVTATVAGGVLGGFAVSGAGMTEPPYTTTPQPASVMAPASPADAAVTAAPMAAPHRQAEPRSTPPRPTPPPPARSPVQITVAAGTVAVDTEAHTPAGTTKDITVVTVECDWWVAGTLCELAP